MIEVLQIVFEHADWSIYWIGSGITGTARLICVSVSDIQFGWVVGTFVFDVIGNQQADLGIVIGLV